MFLLDDLLLAPVHGLVFIARKVQEVVDQELNDETVIKQDLLELQMRLELEEISEAEYAEREAELFARLRAVKERQFEMRDEQIHTAGSSAIVVETGGANGGDVFPARDREDPA